MPEAKLMISKTTIKVFVHFVCICVFIFVPLFFIQGNSLADIKSLQPPVINQLSFSILLVLFFYANYYVFQPQLLFQRKNFLWLGIVILSFFFIIFLSHSIAEVHPMMDDMPPKEMRDLPPMKPNNQRDSRPPMEPNKPIELLGVHLEEDILKFLFVLSISFLLSISDRWRESRKEKTIAELAFLKSQINPHFLFNTLNGIYSLAILKSDKTQDAILRLSEMMRYVVTETEKDLVSLEEEIQYLKNYIELQQLRFDKTINVYFDYTKTDTKLQISPLLLIFFVENAFKYGMSASKIADIDIQMETKEKNLYFCIKNLKINQPTDIATQKGLENVTRRLQLAYPNRHTLKIENVDNIFSVILIINDLR